MTKDVKISITIEIENGQKMTAEFVIQSDHFGEQMMEIQKQIGEMTGKAVLESYDDQIWKEESKGLKVLGRETRVVEMECGEVEIKRRVYQRKDGERWKPLDRLIGVEKYQRRDEKVNGAELRDSGTNDLSADSGNQQLSERESDQRIHD